MKFEIRSVNLEYADGKVANIKISYLARNEKRSISANGFYDLTKAEYEAEPSIDELELKAKQHMLNELQAEEGLFLCRNIYLLV